jgi:hypothetical protein
MKPIRLSISGKMKSGKDYFAEVVRGIIENGYLGRGEPVQIVHVAQAVYEATEFLIGYRLFGKKIVKKTPFERRALQLVGTWGRHLFGRDIWLRQAIKKLEKIEGHVMVSGVRFPNEVIQLELAGFKSVYVEASESLRASRGAKYCDDPTETQFDNISKAHFFKYVVTNNNDDQALYNQAYDVVWDILKDGQ